MNLVDNIRQHLEDVEINSSESHKKTKSKMNIEFEPKIDILIFALSFKVEGGLLTTSPIDYDLTMDINLRAPYVFINFF